VGQAPDAHVVQVGDWLVDRALCRLSRGGQAIHVRPKLVDLLVYLASHAGRVIGKDEILQHVWHGEFVVESVLARSVADLRHLLEDDAATPRYIETIAKRGYRLIAPIRRAGDASAPSRASIAVLPFVDLSPARDQQYLCDGLVEELTTLLAGVPGLRVIARTSAFVFRDRAVDVRDIGRQLGVGTLLEGAVQRADDRVRVTVQMIETGDGSHVWSRRFDRAAGDVFAVQDEIAQAVVAELELPPGGPGTIGARRGAPDSDAHELYLRGRHVLAQRTAPALAAATQYFERAIERDPHHAPAHAGLATCHEHRAFLGYLAPVDGYPRALAAAHRAVELDPALAEAHTVVALCFSFYSWQWEESERRFRRAIELAPSDALAHMAYSNVLAAVGRSRQAFAEAELAQALDPLSPLARVVVAMRLGEARRFDDALEHLRATLAMNPEFGTVHVHLGRTCCLLGRYDEAERHLRQAPPGFPLALGLQGLVLGRLGRREEAVTVLSDLERLASTRYVGAFPFALVHQGLDDLDASLEWYTRAFDAREGIVVVAIADPLTEILRTDPRFAPLVARMKLPAVPS
jgi:TolB-like protein/Tfp pilus assembly protein PilF